MGVIDLDEVLKVWAWEHYLKTNTGFLTKLLNRRLSYNNAIITLNYDHVRITEEKVNYKEVTDKDNVSCTKVVMVSELENGSIEDNKCKYRFMNQGETISTAKITVTKGYSRSCNGGLKMSLPEDFLENGQNEQNARGKQMATASFGNSVHLDTEEGNTVQKTLKWEVETEITPISDKTTKARLEVEVYTNKYTFDLNVKVRGRIIASILNSRGKLVHTVEGNIATVLQDLQIQGLPKLGDLTMDMESLSASLSVEGTVVFQYGVSKKVKVGCVESDCDETTTVQSIYPVIS